LVSATKAEVWKFAREYRENWKKRSAACESIDSDRAEFIPRESYFGVCAGEPLSLSLSSEEKFHAIASG